MSNGCNALNIARKPITDINVNLFISQFRIKICGIDPHGSDIWWKFVKFYFCLYCPMMHANLPLNLSFLSSGSKLWNGFPPESDIWWKFVKFYFCLYCPMMHANLPLNLSFLSSGSKVVEWTPMNRHLVEICEILLLPILSSDACKFTINLSPSGKDHFIMFIYYFFYSKYRFQMTVMCLILHKTP